MTPARPSNFSDSTIEATAAWSIAEPPWSLLIVALNTLNSACIARVSGTVPQGTIFDRNLQA